MMFKAACFFVLLVVGSIAFPLNEDEDMSFFFDNPVDPFIVGGVVKAEHVPHMVALTTGIFAKGFLCGGSIINQRFVLTAAHCIRIVQGIDGSLSSSLRGNLGSNRWASSRIEHRFSRGINHPNYNHNMIKNDIGLLETESNIVFSDEVKPIVLNFDFIEGGAPAIANGWGRLVIAGPGSQNLMELRPVTVDGPRCVSEVARVAASLNMIVPSVDPEVEICSFYQNETGMCHVSPFSSYQIHPSGEAVKASRLYSIDQIKGDSGSALVLEENKQQIGVVSWGIPCARGAPDMFARVSAYKSWIEQYVQ